MSINRSPKEIVIEKMLKMQELLTDEQTKEKFHLWLTIGKGRAAQAGIEKFSKSLEALLKKHNALESYKVALEGENPNQPDGSYKWDRKRGLNDSDTDLLGSFLDKYPDILEFLYKYIPTYLEKVYDVFSHVDKLAPAEQKTSSNTSMPEPSNRKSKRQLAETPVPTLSEEQIAALKSRTPLASPTTKNMLMILNESGSGRTVFEASADQYLQTFVQLGIKGGEKTSQDPISLATIRTAMTAKPNPAAQSAPTQQQDAKAGATAPILPSRP